MVVIVETAVKTPSRNASPAGSTSSVQISATTTAAPTTSRARYRRSSSSRNAARGARRTIARYISAKLIPPRIMKSTITHWVAAANPSIESAFVENPAVGIVVSA